MRIACPYCGDRDAHEFAYLGDAAPRRPAEGADATAWVEYVYMRDNPAGRLREFWYHASGCRAWLIVTRDTRTHEIFSVEMATSPERAK